MINVIAFLPLRSCQHIKEFMKSHFQYGHKVPATIRCAVESVFPPGNRCIGYWYLIDWVLTFGYDSFLMLAASGVAFVNYKQMYNLRKLVYETRAIPHQDDAWSDLVAAQAYLAENEYLWQLFPNAQFGLVFAKKENTEPQRGTLPQLCFFFVPH